MKNLKSQTKPVTVTFAVCALNEEPNIGKLLETVNSQEQIGFTLEKILVLSDGSTDKTVIEAQKRADRHYTIKDYKDRIGKSSRLNEIFHNLTSDYLILADADVFLAHNQVFSELIKTISSDDRIGLVGGDPKPLPATTFTEKAVNLTLEAYIPLRDSYKGGHNVLSATGRLMALKRDLARAITVPKDTISNDGFTYFSCISKGYLYRHAPKATAYFRSPQNLKDHISQNTRFSATPLFMKRYFPADLVDKSYDLPSKQLKINMFKQFIKHPILATYILLINKYCHLKSVRDQWKINAIWDIVYSTKTLQ